MELIRLSWSDDPKTTMTITWQSPKPVPKALIEYGEGKQLARSAEATCIAYSQHVGWLYTVTLKGLSESTWYSYRVGDGARRWSKVHTFRTAPSRKGGLFAFTVFADHGVSGASRRNIERIVSGELPAFHLIPGDLSYANGDLRVWKRWLQMVEPLACRVPLMVCPGNHEYEPQLGLHTYRTLFVLPGTERYYRFDYSGVRFLMLDSVTYNDRAQYQWLEAELRQAHRESGVNWVVVAMHHPLYSSTADRLNDLGRARVLEPLLDRYRPDLVLLGHNHNYERTYPLQRGKPIVRHGTPYTKGTGVIYVTTGGGGHSLYRFVAQVPPSTARRERCFHYLKVTVSEEVLQVEAFRTADGSLLDRFEVVR